MDKGYHRVTATADERGQWVAKYGPRQAPPYRVACDACGQRYWLSGIGVGSHRRSKRHHAALIRRAGG